MFGSAARLEFFNSLVWVPVRLVEAVGAGVEAHDQRHPRRPLSPLVRDEASPNKVKVFCYSGYSGRVYCCSHGVSCCQCEAQLPT